MRHIYFSGTTSSSFQGNTQVGTSQNYILGKISTTGNVLWTKQWGGGNSTSGTGITLDGLGNIIITGSISWGGLDGNPQIGSTDSFITKFDPNGDKLWTKQFGIPSKNSQASAITVSSGNEIIVTGFTNGAFPGENHYGSFDTFVAKFDSNGTQQWIKQFGGGWAYGNSIATDGSNNIIITGYFEEGDYMTLPMFGATDAFITKLDPAGTHLWSKLLGTIKSRTYGNGIIADQSNTIFICGETSGNLDGEQLIGFPDGFISSMTAEGTIK